MVDTELDRGSRDKRGQEYRGILPEEVAIATMKGIKDDEFEIVIGMAQNLKTGSRTEPEKVFQQINKFR